MGTIPSAAFRLWVWGSSEGIGDEVGVNILVPEDSEEIVLDASAGTSYTLFILSDRSVRVGGFADPDKYQGHFGLGDAGIDIRAFSLLPILEVEDLSGDLMAAPEFQVVVAGVESSDESGMMHSVFIDVDGNVYAAGNNNKGQLCLGDTDSRTLPTQILLPDGEIANVAAVGGEFTLILTSSGKIYGCGSNELGQLGLGDEVISTTTPDDSNGLIDVLSISAGQKFALIRTGEGLFGMGDNTYGQLCLDTNGKSTVVPTLIDSVDDVIPSTDVISFKAGRESSYMLFADGSVVACGLNDVGQLGDGTFDNSFGVLSIESGSGIIDIGSGPSARTVFYIKEDGTVSGNGMNNFGQLGVGDEIDRELPTEVIFKGGASIFYISAADTHTVGLSSDGGVDIIPTSPTL
ncbi:hypothetical protein ACHAXA_011247 [Cyclostephanos tholiformis]|uniref:Uncharacterized protein n=1 Tax=Cyclostephanos tholiformis TaxID=382380 RepID=A0ABD3SQE9_9STRA